MYKFYSKVYNSDLICINDGTPLVLPNLFLLSLNHNWTYFLLVQEVEDRGIAKYVFKEKEVSENTIKQWIGCLMAFLEWLESYTRNKKYITFDNHHNLPSEILNYYLNDHMVGELQKSNLMLQKSKSALEAYYNYLANKGFTDIKRLWIKPEFKREAIANTQSRRAEKYLSYGIRNVILQYAANRQERCLMLMGSRCGLRTMENQGLLLNNFKAGKKPYNGLLSLFNEMKNDEAEPEELQKQEFKFWLQGKYSKGKGSGIGGESRWIYIPRDVLQEMYGYYVYERPNCSFDSFFVTNPKNNTVLPIRAGHATRKFSEIRETIIEKQTEGLLPEHLEILEIGNTYHNLRHSFGTDQFFEACERMQVNFEQVTDTHPAYLHVARLLGHSIGDKYAPKTTATYIHSCYAKLSIEAY